MWISRQEYNESGPSIAHRKAMQIETQFVWKLQVLQYVTKLQGIQTWFNNLN